MDTSVVSETSRVDTPDPRHMNVAKLKEELSARNLSTKGLKAQLLERLLEALEVEKTSASDLPAKSTEGSKESATSSVKIEPAETEEKTCEKDAREENKKKAEEEAQTLQVLVPFTEGLDEKVKKSWERRYQLPTNPQMLIHPSNIRKDFDCTQLSLASLMDLSSTDSKQLKEPTFELSIFAQFFHEMLQYGFGLQIFKQLVVEVEITSKIIENGEAKNSVKEEKKPAVAEKVEGASDPKKRKLSTEEENASKITTLYPDLLFSFAYFDLSHCGTIQAADLEEVCLSLGVGLSRSEVMKMIQKVVSPKGVLRYRDWTDKPTDQHEQIKEQDIKPLIAKLHDLIKGNRSMLPVFFYPEEVSSHIESGQSPNKYETSGIDSSIVLKLQQESLVQQATLNMTQNTLNQSKNQVAELTKANESLNRELCRTKESFKKLDSESRTQRGNLDTLKSALESYVGRVHHLIRMPAPKEKDTVKTADAGAKGVGGAGSEGTSSPKSEDN
jgi:DNA-nicking Smr family endonuclease